MGAFLLAALLPASSSWAFNVHTCAFRGTLAGSALSETRAEDDILERWSEMAPIYNGPAYETSPSVTSPYAPGSLNYEFMENGLDIINFARYLAGLPDDVELDPELNADGQYGAVLLSASEFSHHPPKPADMPQDFYDRGYAATSSSNIGMGYGSARSFELSCLGDSDPSNIDRVGHRRWLLNPPMRYTGIGYAEGSITTYAFDSSRTEEVDYDLVAWPSAGFFPVQMFNSYEAWSISLDSNRYECDPNAAYDVTLRRINDARVWTFDSLDSDPAGEYFNADFGGYGISNCFIFRPNPELLEYKPGDEFEVTLSGGITSADNGLPAIVSYRTTFMSLNTVIASVSGGHGIVTPSRQSVEEGASAVINITPDEGYRIASVTDNGAAEPLASPYVINEVTTAHKVVVTFALEGPFKYFFAEGYTGQGFQEYLCLGNPGTVPANAYITYMLADGSFLTQGLGLAANSRSTINANAIIGADKNVSAKVTSDQPIVVERPMYFNYNGEWTGGHDTMGAAAPSLERYFAEGYTGPGFDEYICVLNPGNTAADLTFHFQTQEAGEITKGGYSVGPHTRGTFKVNDVLGSDHQTSLKLDSSLPVVAERPMYFNYNGVWTGGHCVMGAPALSKEYYFAEGTTRAGFEEWITLQNPGAAAIEVEAVYQLGAGQGASVTKSYTIGTGRPSHYLRGDRGRGRKGRLRQAHLHFRLPGRASHVLQLPGCVDGRALCHRGNRCRPQVVLRRRLHRGRL